MSDKMPTFRKNHIVFPTGHDVTIATRIYNRLVYLGWKGSPNSVSIPNSDRNNGNFLLYTDQKNMAGKEDLVDHEWGCLYKLFQTDYYKYDKGDVEVQLNSEYSAKVDKDGITVGCQKFSHKAIADLFEASQKVRSSCFIAVGGEIIEK